MAVNVSEYMNKFQEEGLAALKQTQEASLKALTSFNDFSKQLNEKPGQMPSFENVPSPTQLVEMSFGFASQLLEMRKAYTMKIAEMMVDTQKRFESNVKSATASAQNQNGNPAQNGNPNPVINPLNKPVAK
jgi:hypothetical protein